MFEKASRLKLRFETQKGLLSVEDLWDLPLQSANRTNLDDIARDLDNQVKASPSISFVAAEQAVVNDSEAKLKFDIVLHIIKVRVAENQARINAQAKSEQKQKIMAIINRKQDAALENASIEDLQKMIDTL